MSAAIIAWGAVSPLGKGDDAIRACDAEGRPRIASFEDEELLRLGSARPYAARAAVTGEDRAIVLLEEAWEALSARLDVVRPGWRNLRVGLALGTSSGGMRRAETFFREARDNVPATATDAETFAYFSLGKLRGQRFSPASLVLGACASSTLAIGLGARWIEAGACDLVIAGGFDAVSFFVAAGFECLGATTRTPPPRPFGESRDGMALGEAAALVALAISTGADEPLGFVTGFGAACDAHHITAPHPEGDGLARAAHAAIESRRWEHALVSAHGTGTRLNDEAEAKALARVELNGCTLHAFKGQVGHTLGAAGALELLAALDAVRRGTRPASAGEGSRLVPLLDTSARGPTDAVLKLSAAFGGCNAALAVELSPRDARLSPRPVYASPVFRATEVLSLDELAQRTRRPIEHLAKTDRLSRWVLSAMAALAEVESLDGAGIVLGHSFATLETNALFAKRLAERGVTGADRRLFPYTSPNAATGESAVSFRLTGPAFAVGSGLHGALEAACVAAQLVAHGDASSVVVAAVDDVDHHVRAALRTSGLPDDTLVSGACAFLLTAEPRAWLMEASRFGLDLRGARRGALGHQALLPLAPEAARGTADIDVSGERVHLEARCPWGGFASVEFRRVSR